MQVASTDTLVMRDRAGAFENINSPFYKQYNGHCELRHRI